MNIEDLKHLAASRGWIPVEGPEVTELMGTEQMCREVDARGLAALEQVEERGREAARLRRGLESLSALPGMDVLQESFPPGLRGQVGTHQLLVVPSAVGKGKVDYLVCLLRAQPLPVHLNIYRQGMAASLGKLLGMQDLEIGDLKLDNRLVIKSRDPKAALALLRRFEVTQALAALYDACADAVVNQLSVRAVVALPKTSPPEFEKLLERMSAFLDAFPE